MTLEGNKELVRAYYEDLVSAGGELDQLERFIAPDYTEVYEGERYPLGLDGAREHVLGVRGTYPDIRIRVERQIAEGEWVVSCITMTGTHEGGEWMGIAPTGQAVRISGVNVDRVVDGRIVEHGGAANLLEPLMRIGAVRVVGAEPG